MLGIFIGIASVVALIGLGEGLRIAITAQFGFLGSDVLSVQASGMGLAGSPGTGVTEPLTDDLADKIEKVNGVEAAVNRYIKTGTLEFNNVQGIGMAMSMPDGEDRKVVEDMLNVKTEHGRLLKDGDNRKALLGNSFTNKDNWGGKGIKSGDRVLISGLTYEVIGIMKKKGSFLLDNIILINEDALLNDFGDDGEVDIIGVKVKDEKIIGDIKEDIEKLMRKERGVKEGEENFAVDSPQATLDSLNSTLFAVNLFVILIAAISLIVGGIGIMNTMYTSVLERTKEIGIMKSIGARNSGIFTLFFIESGLLGIVGGIIGIIIGLILAYGLAAVGRAALGGGLIQAHVSFGWIITALLFSFGVGLFAGLTPALQAAHKNPVDALRFSK
ncbi:MAG: ABC transporter permease [Nanoarchaeota archaeon]|nr:ABC transporter permease [Nanoarchaeota archaeon]